MAFTVDSRVMELLCARLCHDLVGPVGALNNGIELLSEATGAPDPEVVALVGESAQAAARRLKALRLAFGFVDDGAGEGHFVEARDVASPLFEPGKVKLEWLAGPADGPVKRSSVKLLLNVVLLAADSLIAGGTLEVRFENTGGQPSATVSAVGRGARLPPGVAEMLARSLGPDQLTARTVHAYYTGLLAESIEARFEARELEPGRIQYSLAFPRAA
ncbi:MAG: histidine phosphotransferase family protein [Alphaproteobacteria bacterium]